MLELFLHLLATCIDVCILLLFQKLLGIVVLVQTFVEVLFTSVFRVGLSSRLLWLVMSTFVFDREDLDV